MTGPDDKPIDAGAEDSPAVLPTSSTPDDSPPVPVPGETECVESRTCRNCGTRHTGTHCHYCTGCGDHLVRNRPQPLWVFAKEAVEETFDFDSKIWRTFHLLLLKPGQLTLEYSAGRRARYTRPTKMYVFLSAIYFLAFSCVSPMEWDGGNPPVQMDLDNWAEVATSDGEPGAEDDAIVRSNVQLGTRGPSLTVRSDEPTTQAFSLGPELHREIDETTSTVKAAFLARLLTMEERVNTYQQDPEQFSRRVSESINRFLPFVMLAYLVIITTALKLLYLDSDYYTSEHLVFATHCTLFLFVTGLLLLPLAFWDFNTYLQIVVATSLIYFCIAQFRFYGENTGIRLVRIFLLAVFQVCFNCTVFLSLTVLSFVQAMFF